MKFRLVAWVAVSAALSSACTTPPARDASTATPSGLEASSGSADMTDAQSATESLEETHRERAQAHARARNWADALVQWELLALLKPQSREYRTAIADTRARIHTIATDLQRDAAKARQAGNMEQATVLYLRVLNVDRENTAAAQALRDIDAERTRRAYLNRPPRGAY